MGLGLGQTRLGEWAASAPPVSLLVAQLGLRERAMSWLRLFKGGGRRGTLQLRCFAITFLAYACTFVLRSPLGVIRHDIVTDLNIPIEHTGWMDTALLLPLGVIQVLSSATASRTMSRRLVLAVALAGSALSMTVFAFSHK
jgi:hypothetical protein